VIVNIHELKAFLKERLKVQLPGERSHYKMHARHLNGSRVQIRQKEEPRKGGVLILLYQDGQNVNFPLIQRPTYDGVHSGQMALPGGKYENSDKDLIETAKRETFEEIGILKDQIEIIGTLSELYVAASNYVVLPVLGAIRNIPKFNLDPKEVAGVITPGISQLIDPSRRKEKQLVVGDGIKLVAPYFDLENKTVWGATAMILSELKDILSEFN